MIRRPPRSTPFPTRRSSDLGDVMFAEVAQQVEPRAIGEMEIEQQAVGRRARAQRDRKSTRLNSSHTVISYAVFCLKKKNNHANRFIVLRHLIGVHGGTRENG